MWPTLGSRTAKEQNSLLRPPTDRYTATPAAAGVRIVRIDQRWRTKRPAVVGVKRSRGCGREAAAVGSSRTCCRQVSRRVAESYRHVIAIGRLSVPCLINFIHRKNFDSSINKEEKKYKKERHTQSTYRNRHTNNTSYSMVKVQQRPTPYSNEDCRRRGTWV